MAVSQPDPVPTVVADPAPVRRLVEAHRAITSDLSLNAALDRIVQAACELVGAGGGALGVIGAHAALQQLVHAGIDDETAARIQAGGFPLHDSLSQASRPSLRALISVRGEPFGELYLAEPEAGAFSAEDEELISALAATSGTAIENARLYEDARRSRNWLNASGEIARALLADADVDMLLEVVSRALHVAEADYGALVLPTEDGRLKVTVTVGLGADYFRGLVFEPGNSPMGRAMMTGESRLTDMVPMVNADFENVQNFGPVMIAPLVDAKGLRGAVLLIRTLDRLAFTPRDLDLATTFADQVALALQLNDARADAEGLRVLEERHRIAEDLHDNVMQRLFAAGMGLQRVADGGLEPNLAARLRRHIVELDETIDEIRTQVFGLRHGGDGPLQRERSRFPRVDLGSGTNPI
jgi:GAF domain-containing protein